MAKALPSLRPKEVTVELGRLWNELGEEGKAPYVAEYTKLWKEFKVEMKNYSMSNKKMDVMEEKESDDMEEIGDSNSESLKTGDVEVNLEVNLEAGDAEVDMEVILEAGQYVEVDMEADDVDVNMEEIVQEADDEVEEEDIDEIE